MKTTSDPKSFLLQSKLQIPRPAAPAVPRPELITWLNEGLERKATMITAPAGYGKTTLASDWARQLSIPVAWVSLDEKDNDLIRFWHYVGTAMEQALDSTSCSLRFETASLTPGQYEPFLVELLNKLTHMAQPLLLALDDWHVINDLSIISSMSFLLDYLPPSVHICFISRTTPEWSKVKWTTRGWTNEFDIGYLRFNLQETLDFFRMNTDQEIAREQVEQMLVTTEGWVTGLKLFSLVMRRRERFPSFPTNRMGERVRIEQYLLEEVFDALDEATQHFLLAISVLSQFNGSLCERLTGVHDGAGKLAELTAANLFLIPLDDDRQWYRFHHLFADFLRILQKRRSPEQTAELYHAAALWSEQQGLEEDAVDYYLTGEHYRDAIRLLVQMKSFMVRRQFSTLRAWLSAIPEELLREHHYLYFSYVLSLLWDNDPGLAERHLQSAEQYYKHAASSWSREEQDRYLGNLYYIRNFKVTKYDMDLVKGLEYIRLALQHSPTGTDLLFGSPTMPLAPSVFRSYTGKRGKHLTRELADPFFQNMIEFMTPMGIQASTVVCYGELLYERNELDQAEACLKQGLRDTALTPHEREKVYIPAYLFLSRISKARQDYTQARKWLEEVREKAGKDLEQAREAFILIDAEMAALRLDAGDLSAAVQWKELYRVSSADPVSVYQLFVYIFLLRVLTETGEYEAAWQLSEKLLYVAEKDHRPMDALEIQVLQAMILQRTGKPERAVLSLEVALEYAEPDDYIRVFLDKGQRVAELLIEYIQLRQKGSIRDKITPSLAYTRRILACFGSAALSADQSETALETLLTKRELEVFRCMEEGLDNAAITEKLGIGMGTLKAHINRIYSKFQVTNRIEAIRRGKELKGL